MKWSATETTARIVKAALGQLPCDSGRFTPILARCRRFEMPFCAPASAYEVKIMTLLIPGHH